MRKFVLAIVMGAALVASAVASGGGKPGPSQGQAAAGTLVVNNTVSKAAAAKPGPEGLTGSVGTVVRDNSRLSKPGVAAAGPASVVLGKTPSFAASPALRGYIVVNSGDLSNPNGTQSFGSVSCPTAKTST